MREKLIRASSLVKGAVCIDLVHLLSEICTADGRELLPSIWQGQPPTNSYSKLLWPRQARPSATSWRIWRRFLTQVLRPASYTVYSTRLQLQRPLGPWLTQFDADRQWSWFCSPASSSLLRFDRLAKSFQVHPVNPSFNRLTTDIDPESCCYSLPPDAIPCDPRMDYENDIVCLPIRFPYSPPMGRPQFRLPCPYTDTLLPTPNLITPSSDPPPHTWQNYCSTLPQWESDLLPHHIDQSVPQLLLDAHRHRATIYHCSDGSSINNHGSFGWAFGPNMNISLQHAGIARGSPMDSYLAESYGLLSSACFWFRLTKFVLHRKYPHFRLQFYCDNKSLVRRVNNFLHYLDGSFRRCLIPNYDVVFMAACVLRLFPPEMIELQHIKGHQDSIQPVINLSWPAQLNVRADRLAEHFLQHSTPAEATPFLPSAQIHLKDSHNNIVIKRWNFHLRSSFHRYPYERWLLRQFKWTTQILHTVDFEGLDLTLRSLPTHLQRFVLKWINQSLPIRRRVHRYDKLIPSTCRNCPDTTECDLHLLQCQSDLRRSACANAYLSIQTKLSQLHTKPILQQGILHLLATAFLMPTCTPPLHDAAREQHNIGTPILFLKGRWSRQFRLTQENYYREQHRGPTFTGNRWMRQILSLMFDQLHQIWMCRNNQTHGSDQRLQDQFQRDQLTLRVKAIYNQLPNLLAHDRHAFESITEEELLSGPTSSISTWLRLSEPTIRRCLKDAHNKLISNQTDIRDFLEDGSYIYSSASDESLSFDTAISSGTISFITPDYASTSTNSTISTHDSSEVSDSGLDDSFCPSPTPDDLDLA